MTTYIARRALLMVPTLVGITLLVFLLIAAAPGGMDSGAGPSGSQSSAAESAQRAARLNDRYGLDDPLLVQYGRWLARISPIKFGPRDRATPSGELARVPRALKPPALAEWWGGAADASPAVSSPASSSAQHAVGPAADRAAGRAVTDGAGPSPEHDRASAATESAKSTALERWKESVQEFARQRSRYVDATTELRAALERYANEVGLRNAFTAGGLPRESVFEAAPPRTERSTWLAVAAAGANAAEAYQRASSARDSVAAALAEAPLAEVGMPILPGLISLAVPDLGVTLQGERVVDRLGRALPVTLLLNAVAFFVIYLIAVPSGMLAAARRGTALDVGLGALLVALWSVPTILAGVLAMGFLADPTHLGWFPVRGLHSDGAENFAFLPSFVPSGAEPGSPSGTATEGSSDSTFQPGYLLDLLWHLCLPAACLIYGGFAVLSRQTRAAMLENLGADYVRTATAKGLPRRTILVRHVFRNSLLPLITIFVGLFPALLGGSVVVESIFTLPGTGQLALAAIRERDRELMLANTLLVAVVNLVAMLLADILYAVADPRVSYE